MGWFLLPVNGQVFVGTQTDFFLSDDRILWSPDEKRVSVLIGSQLIGTAQMKRARLRHGRHRSHGSEE